MFTTIASLVARITSRRASARWRSMQLIAGTVLFLVIVPAVLIPIVRKATARFRTGRRNSFRLAAGIPTAMTGLAVSAWSVAVFWTRGGGTPSPLAAPGRLVTGGPFRFCRNPILFGMSMYYFGIGCLAESLGAGLVMLTSTGLFGCFYHRFIEERELLMRFGGEYECYRRNTPYIIPRFCSVHSLSSTGGEQERKS